MGVDLMTFCEERVVWDMSASHNRRVGCLQNEDSVRMFAGMTVVMGLRTSRQLTLPFTVSVTVRVETFWICEWF